MPISSQDVMRWLRAFQDAIVENKDLLTELDSAIGDADHGINMDRGMRAVVAKLDGREPGDIGSLFKTVGMTLVSSVGGAGGPLYGTLFLQMGTASGGRQELDTSGWADALDSGVRGVRARGKAELGDKTMIDALVPAVDAAKAAAAEGASLAAVLAGAAAAAEEGMRRTIPMVARKGRASYLGERSAGHQDPGATSSYLLLRCAAEAMSERNDD